jgi:membrane-associated phospholipid phosphatase
MARTPKPGIDLRPGPFLRVAASRLDLRSRRGFPVTVAATVAVLSFLGFVSLALVVRGPGQLPVDVAAVRVASAAVNPVCTWFMWVATLMGDARVMVVETAVAALLLAAWGHPRRAGSVVILVLAGAGIAEALKLLIARVRPDLGLSLLAGSSAYRTSFSFPSGHALAGILLFGTLALMLAASPVPRALRWWGGLGVAAVGLTIGLSRVYLGVHYMSDVIGSWLLGLTMLSTWAAAVLVWGRTHPPIGQRVAHPWGRVWWRWALAAAGAAAWVVALVMETGITRLR